MGRRRIRIIYSIVVVFFIVLLSSCPTDLMDVQLKEEIQTEVEVATAQELTLTITSDGNGVLSQSGSISVKENISISIEATPFSTHAFMNWEKVSGNGDVTFGNVTSPSTSVILKNGDATIRPVFEIKPTVLFSVPIGNNIGKDVSALITMAKNMDATTINTTTVKLKKLDGTEISGHVEYANKVITFNPDATLANWTAYYIELSTAIKDEYGIPIDSTYVSTPFQTNDQLDVVPPSDVAFDINNNAEFTNDPNVLLTNIYAVDNFNAVAWMKATNSSGSYSSFENFDATMAWVLDTGAGSNEDGQKTVYMTIMDSTLNNSSEVSDTIKLDLNGPTGSIAVDDTADGSNDGYLNTNSITLNLTVTDPNLFDANAGSGPEAMMIANNPYFTNGEWDTGNNAYMTPAWVSNDGSITTTSWTTNATDGTKTIYIKFKDTAGNEGSVYSASFVYDTTGPVGTISINGGNSYTGSTGVSLTLSAIDAGIGVNEMRFSGDIVGGTTAWLAYNTSYSPPLTSGDGTKTINVEYRDTFNNTAAAVSSTIYLDQTSPTASSISINSGAAETGSQNVSLSISGVDETGGSGISEMIIDNNSSFAGGSWIPYSTSYDWTLTAGDGTKTVYIKFRDNAGNESSAISDTIVLDTTPPDGSFTINSGATYTTSTTVTLTIASSSAATMQFSNDGTTWSGWEAFNTSKVWAMTTGDGLKTVYTQLRDASSNVTQITDQITLDTVAPSISTFAITGSANHVNYTNDSAPNLTIGAGGSPSQMRFSNDNSTWSGWQAYATSYTNWPLTSGDGAKTVYIQVRDAAGNVSSTTDTITLDRVAPTLSSFSINSGATYTTSATVTLNSSASDSSGVSKLQVYDGGSWSAWENYTASRTGWALYYGSTDGTKGVYLRVQDNAGNISSYIYDSIILDTVAPTVSSIVIDSGRTYTYDRAVSVAVSDGGTGAYQMSFYYDGAWTSFESYATTKSITLSSSNADGTKYIYVRFKDEAGNIGSYSYDTIFLDRPAIQYVTKGRPAAKGQVKIYFTPVSYESGSTMAYRVWSSETPTGTRTYRGLISASGAAVSVGSDEGKILYFHIQARNYIDSTYLYGELISGDGTNPKSGFAADIIIVYDANDATDTTTANAIESALTTDLPATNTHVTGTMPSWSVVKIDEDDIPNAYAAANILYGTPVIVTPGTTFTTATTYDGRVKNIVSGGRGIIGMGYDGSYIFTRTTANFTAWGLSGQAPSSIEYADTTYFAAVTYGKTWTSGNSVYSSPLQSTTLPTTNSTSFIMSYSPGYAYRAIKSVGGVNPTDGWLYGQSYTNPDYFPIVRQGRFLLYGYTDLMNFADRGRALFINLVYRMSAVYY